MKNGFGERLIEVKVLIVLGLLLFVFVFLFFEAMGITAIIISVAQGANLRDSLVLLRQGTISCGTTGLEVTGISIVAGWPIWLFAKLCLSEKYKGYAYSVIGICWLFIGFFAVCSFVCSFYDVWRDASGSWLFYGLLLCLAIGIGYPSFIWNESTKRKKTIDQLMFEKIKKLEKYHHESLMILSGFTRAEHDKYDELVSLKKKPERAMRIYRDAETAAAYGNIGDISREMYNALIDLGPKIEQMKGDIAIAADQKYSDVQVPVAESVNL